MSDEEYSGFIAAFEVRRSKSMLKRLETGKGFEDSFSVDDWGLLRKEIFFLSLNNRGKEIDAVALVQRAHGLGGTGKPKYSIDKTIIIKPAITEEELSEAIPNLRDQISSPARGFRLDPTIWVSLIERIIALRPNISAELAELLKLVDKKADLLGGSNRIDRLAEQRDGLGVALDIGNGPRSSLLMKLNADRAETANSILDLFDELPIHERHLVEHDKVVLENIFDNGYRGASIKSDDKTEVRIYVADKTSLETALGTDLIIYQTRWNSILLVQYKMMINGGGQDDGWHYRPDRQFEEQTEQINDLMASYPENPASDMWNFRLCNMPFYFKFCDKRRPANRDDSLVKGMSISWKILQQFLDMPVAQGPRGGLMIGYKNCPRYLNNTEFSGMARNGWLGSNGEGTDYLVKKIKKALSPNREKLVAVIDSAATATRELRKGGSKDVPLKTKRGRAR